jgi:hypothetical protein
MSQSITQDMETDKMDTNGSTGQWFGLITGRSVEAMNIRQKPVHGPKLPRRDVFRSDELEYVMITEVGAKLHSSTQN